VDNVVDDTKFQRKNSGKSAVMGGGGQKMINLVKAYKNQPLIVCAGSTQ
jgi:hypothetical protein